MLEGLAAWVLNTYVGEYVENLNTKQLSIGLLQGEVELENLPLRKDALRHLDLPLEVKAGFIGRIKLQIPVSRLKSEPWVISIEKLYLVAAPREKYKYDEAAERQADLQRKQAQLQALEDKWKNQRKLEIQGDGGGYSSWFSFGSSLATNIVENIQLNVKDVHLRYEDNTTIPNCSFACGVVIKSLAAQSTDGGWVPKFVSRYDADMMHKLVDLQNFSVYWDIDAAMVGHLPMSELADALQREMGQSASTGDFMDHQYILEPVTAQARMRRNTSPLPLRSPNSPRLKLDIELEKIPFALSEAQYRGMLGWMKEFDRHEKSRRYRKWRPSVPVKEKPKLWWKFAITSTLHFIQEQNRQLTWSFIIQRAKDNVLYVEAYTKYLTIGSYYMESKLKSHMDNMEDECTFEEIRILREIVMDSMAEEEKLAESAQESYEPEEACELEDPPPQSEGVFQRWFPGWGGWYGYSQPATSPGTEPSSETLTASTAADSPLPAEKGPPVIMSETETEEDKKLEKEIMDVLADTAENNTLLKRDTVFAQLNFCLQHGTFKLLSSDKQPASVAPVKDKRTLLELECSSIRMGFESRPRTSGLKFGISVGGLFLRDKMTSGSIMPVLVSPQVRDRGSQPRQFFGSMLGGGSLLQAGTLLGSLAPKPPKEQQEEETLFEMTYEKKPAQSSADYRLAIKTKPLDIVYNSAAIHRVKEFFTIKSSSPTSQKTEMEIAVAAKARYEKLKKQTQEELKQTLDELLEGDDKIKAKRWDFDFDISAPQFVVLEDSCNKDSVLVKFDLGHLQFHNSNRQPESKLVREMSEDTEDDFVTPSSTPPNEKNKKEGTTAEKPNTLTDVFSQDLSESALHDLLYDKYTLKLSELQVMVGKARDNWKHAHVKGTSPLHVVDKFSITLQFERRLLYTSDPQWPKATLSGTLPSLVLHVNEQKIQGLRNCSRTLSSSSPASENLPPPPKTSRQGKSESEGLDKSMYSMYQTYNKSIASIPEAVDEQAQEAFASSRLLLMQFAINNVSLEVQTRGRSIAELQVSGVKANVTRHLYDTSMSLTVHSLLVVDALQTFGQDFELLVASHKNLCLDSRSGSIRGSDPSSPLSPHSPQSPSSPMEQEPPPFGKRNSFQSVQAAVSSALQSLLPSPTGPPGLWSPESSAVGSTFVTTETDSEALIKLELFTISPNCPGNSSEDHTLNVANLQFNNLDFVANQQTIVELLGFFQRVMPNTKSKKKKSASSHSAHQYDPHMDKTISNQSAQVSSSRLEVTAEFHRLNVLLMRAEEKDCGIKVATATLSKAKIQARLDDDLECEGSLGGLQLQDLTPEGTRHSQIISLGVNPDAPELKLHLPTSLSGANEESLLMDPSAEKAFTFSFIKPVRSVATPVTSPGGARSRSFAGNVSDEEARITLRMASLCYSHSPTFLQDLSVCLNEFQEYMSSVGSSIKDAATGVAMGWVRNRPDLLGMSMYGSNLSLDNMTPSNLKSRVRDISLNEEHEVQFPEIGVAAQKEEEPESVLEKSLKFKVDAILQTPVIMLPRKPQSSEVLVAHLGKMTMWNSNESRSQENKDAFLFEASPQQDKIHLLIKDMRMFSVDLDQQRVLQQEAQKGLDMSASTFSTPQPGGYMSTSYGTPILHETAMELTIQKVDPKKYYVNPGDTLDDEVFPSRCKHEESNVPGPDPVLEIKGKVVTPFQWVLSKQVYEQILQTLDNITPEDPLENHEDSVPSPGSFVDQPAHSPEPTTSPLKLDQPSFTCISQTSLSDKPASASQSHESSMEEKPLTIRAHFEMPIFKIKMIGDLGEKEKGLVDISLQDFKIQYTKSEACSKTLEVSLQSLVMEDLLQKPDSQHRYLMVSRVQSQPGRDQDMDEDRPPFLSTSCPTSMIAIPQLPMPPSLPSSLNMRNVFVASEENVIRSSKTLLEKSKSEGACPSTPPPSYAQSRRSSVEDTIEDKLVKIKVTLVDRKYPEYAKKFNKTNRIVEIDFACLDTTINLQTWVVLLDFLGMGAKVHNLDQYSKLSHQASDVGSRQQKEKPEEVVNTEVDIKVQSLTLTLNKTKYELAKANVSAFGAHLSLRDGNFAIAGELGSMSLLDQSPHGHLYRERFITTGKQALDFNIFKYGLPDPDLVRDYDTQVHMRMASVRYVHTHRFLQEVLAFTQHFNQLQDIMGRMRAASAGEKISEKAFRAGRISMDIEAGAPIMLIPHSSQSTDILVMNMGNLTVKNTFLLAGSSGTISGGQDQQKQVPVSSPCASDTTLTAGSTTSVGNLSFQTCRSGTVGGTSSGGLETSSASGCSDAMTQSLYGSLDGDWRSGELESIHGIDSGSAVDPVVPAAEGTTSSIRSPFHSASEGNFFSSSLGSYYSSMGLQTPSVSRIRSTPCFASRSSLSTIVAGNRRNVSGEGLASSDNVDPSDYCCLLDVMQISLVEMDLFSAERLPARNYREKSQGFYGDRDIVFPSYVAVRTSGRLLKEQCQLELQVERNLEGDLSHNVPDFAINGALSSVHCSVDIAQYKLLRGLLEHNFGEPLEEFQTPMMSQLQDPKIHTVLSGEVWKSIAINLDLRNVTVELLVAHEQTNCPEASLARLDFVKSRLIYESFSDQSKDIDLVSHEISMHDTRYRDAPANARPNVFTAVLQPSRDRLQPDSLQMELHYRSNKDATRFTILLNTMRLMGIFDWLLAVQDFLLTNAENPFRKDLTNEEANDYEDSQLMNLSVASGILSKRGPIGEKVETPFELRLNVTDTEFVVVDNMTTWDTSAVIVKSTAVLLYRPSFAERPLSCSLQSLEVFSCSLAAEDETALSIIDPMTVTMELNSTAPCLHHKSPGPTGLVDATSTEDKPPILEVSFNALNLRLSYNDLKLFMAILKSVPHQALQAKNQQVPRNAQPSTQSGDVSKLEALGFGQADCEQALKESDGQLDDAAMWLTQNAAPLSPKMKMQKKSGLQICGFEVKASSICFCLIDDCQDADVPLAELTFSSIYFLQKFENLRDGVASFKLSGDFYNRTLSGWEPFLETWGCLVKWQQGPPEGEKLCVSVRANDALNLNVTSVLLDQYRKTKAKWTEDYYKTGHDSNDTGSSIYRRRVPFIPFAMRNHTGCPLFFATVITSPTRISPSGSQGEGRVQDSQYQVSEWKLVLPGDELPFLIEEREKIRHKHTHELKVHQVVVRVSGWKEVTPVSVDKVGIYFRQARPEKDNTSSMYTPDLPPARIVFDVSLEGSARKVITVRSSLMLHNRLNDQVEVMLEDPEAQQGSPAKSSCLKLKAHSRMAVPLPKVFSRLWVRPVGWSVGFCNRPIHWHHVMKPGEINDSIRSCDTKGGETDTFKFCVSVIRQNFPADHLGKKAKSQGAELYPQPGHVITLMPPVRVANLLPVEMTYYFKNSDTRGNVKPGKTASLFSVDLAQTMELGILLENFTSCKELMIPPGTTDYKVKLRIYDTQERKLELWVYIKAGMGGSLKLSIAAPFWLMNKSGLPLVFKQDNTRHEAGGQFEEHELARSVTPLLFSYSDKEASFLCAMRVGKSVHGPGTVPQWCHKFSLERGIGVRQLHVSTRDTRPDWVYNIGIEVRQGRGVYHDTNIVTFAPRYQLDNRTSHKLAFSQRHLARGHDMTSSGHLSALPSCKLSFHWPRLDLDQLLCVRIMGDPQCKWSGGFRIDGIDSFHINMRTLNNEGLFLRVDIVLQGATFFIVLTDADHMPPPYRIDNFSFVPLLYFQTKVVDESLRTYIKPLTSVPYALDEPVLPAHITLSVQGGSSATYNMNSIADGDQLFYENFIYIAFSGTFKGLYSHQGAVTASNRNTWHGYDRFVETQELVLDVVKGNHVVLKKKETGKRSQLWRMTSTGMLQHEGSSVPRDPRRSPSAGSAITYVLDISDIALQPGHEVALVLKKPDERRKSTQTWRFTEDGRLCLGSGNVCVQTKDGMFGLVDGSEAVLGPTPPLTPGKEVPIEMAIHRQKLRPGSGLLSVKVITDGPTRVLQVTDIRNQLYMSRNLAAEDWVLVEETCDKPPLQSGPGSLPDKSNEKKTSTRDLQLSIHLSGGVGVSLVNRVPEELLYLNLKNIDIDYSATADGQLFEASIQSLQADNQLFGTLRPVLLFVTPPAKDRIDTTPAIQLSIHRIPNNKWNAEIFKHLMMSVKKLTLQIEECLLWKLLQFIGSNQNDTELGNLDESSGSQRALTAATDTKFKRYYFGNLRINTSRIVLSMLTSVELPHDLLYIKKSMGVPLVKFEDAKVELDPFIRVHPFETSAFLLDSVLLHYTEELKSQAAKILGSVDFLGNPLGLFNDVTEGISGLLKDGNVGGLFKNVTHGVSNSAAKVTGSLSDGVGVLAVDENHERLRRQIRQGHTGTSTDHLVAGIKGLGHGILGGVTSIVSQTYTGAKSEGFEGLITGFGKGVVGTVTKPVAGVLDLASGAASAVRDTSRGSSRMEPPRSRKPRCCYGPGGLLPAYSEHHASAQEYLFTLNANDYSEMFVAIEQLRFGREDSMRVLISSEHVYFLGRSHHHDNIVLKESYGELCQCRSIPYDKKFYIELTSKADSKEGMAFSEPRRRPLVRCDSESIAKKVAQQINYAKNLFDEIKQTLQHTQSGDE